MHPGFFSQRIFRLEAAAVFVVLIAIYIQSDASWLIFALLILAPDLSALGYIAGSKPGALSYNIGHTVAWPALIGVVALAADSPLALSVGIIWGAHIMFDRAVGYGFKDPNIPLSGRRPTARLPRVGE